MAPWRGFGRCFAWALEGLPEVVLHCAALPLTMEGFSAFVWLAFLARTGRFAGCGVAGWSTFWAGLWQAVDAWRGAGAVEVSLGEGRFVLAAVGRRQ